MSKSKINIKNVEHSNNGGTTTVKVTKKQQIQINYDTSLLDEGFYTTFLGIYHPGKISMSDVLSLRVSTKADVNMNLNLLLSKDENSKIKEDSYVLFQPDDNTETWILPVEDGTFCIPGGSTGTLTLPLKNLDNCKNLSMETIGFIVVLPESSSTALTIGDLQLKKDTTIAQSFGTYCIMHGEEQAEIPTQGEYVYKYSLITERMEKQDVKYSLITPQQGVHMSEDGILTINDDAECTELAIMAQVDSNTLLQTTINLVQPWYVDQNMPMFSLPKASDVMKYSQKDESIFYQYSTSVRAAIVVLFLVFLAYYTVTIKTKKRIRARH